MPSLKIEGDLGFAKLISNTSYYHRKEKTGYDGTLYNLGFYQTGVFLNGDGSSASTPYPLLDGNGIAFAARGDRLSFAEFHRQWPAEHHAGNSPAVRGSELAAVLDRGRRSSASDRQSYLEQIHDPLLNELSLAATGCLTPIGSWIRTAIRYL